MKLTMPAEWEAHERTWMAWPPANYLLGQSDAEAEAENKRLDSGDSEQGGIAGVSQR